jgi:dienelactone hydrolase
MKKITRRLTRYLLLVVGGAAAIAACASTSTRVEFPSATPSQVTIWGTLMVPEGAGRFPAVVLLHGVGGVRKETRLFDQQPQWAKAGFASLVVDSYGPRGKTDQLHEYDREIARERISDAYGAIRYLQSRSDIDPDRIAVIGFSDGGRVALAVAGGLGPGAPLPRAAVGYYPNCHVDITALKMPFLAHVAGLDDWPGPVPCPKLFAKLRSSDGAKLVVFTYPDTYHAFNLSGSLTPVHVGRGTVQYNTAATSLAWDRTLAFLKEQLGLQ